MDREIKSFSIDELSAVVSTAKIPSFRVNQILSWLYVKSASSYDEMTNLPKPLREQFHDAYPLHVPKIIDKQLSKDGTRKYLIEFHDGMQTEMVGMPSEERLTVCISSQSGCAMRCAFCATGKNGLKRNLLPGEIVDQVNLIQSDFDRRVSNVVVMGQGEPFANFDNVIAALQIINHPKLLNIGARHITISTCGIIDGIDKFANIEEQFTLAVSLHSAVQITRNEIMPKLSNQPLDSLKIALERYIKRTNRRVSFEYALMKGINDSDRELDALIEYCNGLLCHVNIIPLNEVDDSPFKPVTNQTMRLWEERIGRAGIPVSIRNSRGSDIDAACGQLALKHNG